MDFPFADEHQLQFGKCRRHENRQLAQLWHFGDQSNRTWNQNQAISVPLDGPARIQRTEPYHLWMQWHFDKLQIHFDSCSLH